MRRNVVPLTFSNCFSLSHSISEFPVKGTHHAVHASQSICWEVSPELRELVRLTGIGPVTLLCCKSLARWSTIGISVLLLAPLQCFAFAPGGVTATQLHCDGRADGGHRVNLDCALFFREIAS